MISYYFIYDSGQASHTPNEQQMKIFMTTQTHRTTRWPRDNATGRGAGRSGFESRVEVMLAKNHSSWCEGKLPTLPFLYC